MIEGRSGLKTSREGTVHACKPEKRKAKVIKRLNFQWDKGKRERERERNAREQ